MQKFQWLLIAVNSDDYSSSIDFYVFNISFLHFKNWLVKMIQSTGVPASASVLPMNIQD